MSGWFKLKKSAEQIELQLLGSWRIGNLEQISASLGKLDLNPSLDLLIDTARIEAMDTSGAMVLLDFITTSGFAVTKLRFINLSVELHNILQLVQASYAVRLTNYRGKQGEMGLLAHIGKFSENFFKVSLDLFGFIGQTTLELLHVLFNPRTLRFKELVAQFEYVFWNAIPIVALLTFLIGVVVAYLFGIQTEKYGANIFIVDGVSLAMCRELSPILVAIIVAGRSGSAFTAQIGTMKLNEEVDALFTLGLSPMRVLVVPRVLALMLAMPFLVFVGDVFGILGGILIADTRLGITGATFIERLHAVLPVRSFLVGVGKSPVFAAFIAMIGCHLGLTVESNARSVGLNTTATVVRSIVVVILLNAGFAVLFAHLRI